MVYFHCKTIRNASNITVNFETSRSKIRPFRLQKSEKSPAQSCSDCFQSTLHLICFDTALCEEPHLSVMTLCDLPSLWNEWCIYIALFVYCCTPKELYQFTNFNINLWNSTSFFLNFNISISIYWKVEGVNDCFLDHCQVSSVPHYCGFKEQDIPGIYTVWMVIYWNKIFYFLIFWDTVFLTFMSCKL